MLRSPPFNAQEKRMREEGESVVPPAKILREPLQVNAKKGARPLVCFWSGRGDSLLRRAPEACTAPP